jgi:hypothetical protein
LIELTDIEGSKIVTFAPNGFLGMDAVLAGADLQVLALEFPTALADSGEAVAGPTGTTSAATMAAAAASTAAKRAPDPPFLESGTWDRSGSMGEGFRNIIVLLEVGPVVLPA